MNGTQVRVGLVEFHVDLDTRPARDLPTAMLRSILREPTRRAALVRAVLTKEQLQSVDVLVFPGWTLVGSSLPQWVAAACGRRVVALEMINPRNAPTSNTGKAAGSRSCSAYVIASGNVVVRNVVQRVVTAGDVASGRDDVLRELSNRTEPHRAFKSARLGNVGLLVCGEVNIVKTKRSAAKRAASASNRRVFQSQLPAGFPELSVILNPAHTPTRLPAMHEKRSHLSAGGRALLTTSNTHGRWRHGSKMGPSGSVAGDCYINGKQQLRQNRLGNTKVEVVSVCDGACVRTFDFVLPEH